MTYLFWAFAVVWIGLFAYLYGLVRRSRALERQVTDLLDRTLAGSGPPRTGAGPAGAAGPSPTPGGPVGGAARAPRRGASGGIAPGQ